MQSNRTVPKTWSLGTCFIVVLMIVASQPIMAQALTAIITAKGKQMQDGDTTKLCSGSTIDFSAGSTDATSTWQWTFAGGSPAVSTLQKPIVNFTAAGIFLVQLVATNAAKETDTARVYVDVSGTKPFPGFSFTPDNVCGNIPIQFTNSATGATGYLWNFGDGTTATDRDPLHAIAIPGTGSAPPVPVKLVAVNDYGCKDSVTRNVTIKRIPHDSLRNTDLNVDFFYFNGVPTFKRCAADVEYIFKFENASLTIASNTEYTFNWGDGSPLEVLSVFTTPIMHKYAIGNHELTLTIKNNAGCINEKKYNVFLGTNPALGVSNPGNTDICAPDVLTFGLNSFQNNPPGTKYTVTFNDGSLPLSFTHPPPATVDHLFTTSSCGVTSDGYPNSFKILFEAENACRNTPIPILRIYVSKKPVPKINFSPDSVVCINSVATISDISTGGNYASASGCDVNTGAVWEITPATGWTLTGGSNLGNFGGNKTNFLFWDTKVSANPGIIFTQKGNYTIKLFKGNRCGIDSTTRQICIRDAPQAKFSVDNKTGCAPLTVSAANQSTPPSCGADIYSWSAQKISTNNCSTGSSPAPVVTGTNASFGFTVPGTYEITLTSTARNNPNCKTAYTETVTIKDKPRMQVAATAAICIGDSVKPTATAADCYGSISTYQWITTGGIASVPPTLSTPGFLTYAATGSYSIQLLTGNECGTTTAATPLQVVALPAANAGRDTAICSAARVTLGTPAITGYTYLWKPSTGLSSTIVAQPVFTLSNTTGTDQQYAFTVTVRVGSGGCVNTDTVVVTVRPAPAVTVTPATVAVCSGDSVLLRASGASVYNWVPTGSVRPATGDSVWARPAATSTYTITGTDAYGCMGSAPATVTVKPLPNTNAGNDFTACLRNEEITLTGTPAGGVWSGTAVTALSNNYTFNPSVAGLGVHTLYYTATLNGCSKTDSLVVTVATLQSVTAGNDTTVCQNSIALQLKGIPTGGSWSGSPNVTSAGSFSTLQSGTFTLVYTFGAGSCRSSDEVVVTVLPGISSNTIRSRQDICVNALPQLLEGTTPAGGGGAFTYQWQESTDSSVWTNIAGAVALDYQPPRLTNTRYYRRIVTSGMCNGPQQNLSNAVTVVVHANAVAAFTAASHTGCAPFKLDSVLIKTNRQPAVNGTYLWYANGGPINTVSSPAFPGYTITKEEDSVLIRLVVQSQWGCLPDTAAQTFVTVAGATASFTKDKTNGCTPVTVMFTNTSSRINGINPVWNFGNGQTSTQPQPGAVTFTGSNMGNDTTYRISLTLSNGCTTSVYRDSVKVRPLPKAIFGVDTTAGCSPLRLRINNTSRGGPATYFWDYGNGDTAITRANGVINYTYYTGVVDTFLLKMHMQNECGTDSLAYYVVVSPNQIKPQVTVSGNQLFGCAPHTVSFINTTVGASRFIWNFDDGSPVFVTSAIPQTITHTFKDTGTYNVSIRITNGCSDTVVNRQIVVSPSPQAAFSFIQKPYCEKEVVSFNNASANAQSYQWLFGDGNTSSVPSPGHMYNSPGFYTVKLIAYKTNAFGNGCTDTLSRTVEVVPRPVAAINASQGTVNCAPYAFSAFTSRAGALNANWSFDDPYDTARVVGFIVAHTFTKAGIYRVKLVVFNAAGCVDSAFMFVRVQATPAAAFTPRQTITCATDTTIGFSNTGTYSGTDATETQWLVDGMLVAATRNLSYRFRLPGSQLLPKTFMVQAVTTNTFGCRDTATGTLRINPTPIAAFSVQNTSLCAPLALRLTNSAQYADAFGWYVNDTLVSRQSVPPGIVLKRPGSSYRITLIATNVYGCRADTFTLTVTTPPAPAAAFSISDSLGCTGVLDVAMLNQSAGAISFVWDFGDQAPLVFTANTKHLYPQPGEYQVMLVANNGICRDTAYKTVRVGIRPVASFEVDTASGCRQIAVNFRNLSANALSYVWNFGDGNFSGQKNPAHSYSFIRSPYTVRLIATGQYGCADTAVRLNYIRVLTPPDAAFNVLPSAVIEIPERSFAFVDQSTNLKTPDYRWSFGDGNTSTAQSPKYTYRDTGSYQVQLIVVNTGDGCTDTALQQVRIMGIAGWLQVPNAFEPGSGRSDLKQFLPKGIGLKTYRLQVFNNWGELVFETTRLDEKGRPSEGWDGLFKGQLVQQDVYVWKIQATLLNGTAWKGMQYPGGSHKKTGTITVIK